MRADHEQLLSLSRQPPSSPHVSDLLSRRFPKSSEPERIACAPCAASARSARRRAGRLARTASSFEAAARKRASSACRRSRTSASVAMAALSRAGTPASPQARPPRAMKAAKPGDGACSGQAQPCGRWRCTCATLMGGAAWGPRWCGGLLPAAVPPLCVLRPKSRHGLLCSSLQPPCEPAGACLVRQGHRRCEHALAVVRSSELRQATLQRAERLCALAVNDLPLLAGTSESMLPGQQVCMHTRAGKQSTLPAASLPGASAARCPPPHCRSASEWGMPVRCTCLAGCTYTQQGTERIGDLNTGLTMFTLLEC